MIRIDAFLVTYASLAFGSAIVLSLFGIQSLDVYVALFAILFFVASELIPLLTPGKSIRKTLVEGGLIAVFALVAIERALQIIK